MGAQLNVGGAIGALSNLNIGSFFKELFDDPEGTTKNILKDFFEQKKGEKETVERLVQEAEGHQGNGKMREVLAAIGQGGMAPQVIQRVDRIMDPQGAARRYENLNTFGKGSSHIPGSY